LNYLNPDNRFHPTKIGKDDHRDPDQNYRSNDDHFSVRSRLKGNIDRCQDYGCQQQPYAIGDVAHYDKERRSQYFYFSAEPAIEQLVNGQQLSPKIRGNEQKRNDNAAE
jgi:hypothetical protein